MDNLEPISLAGLVYMIIEMLKGIPALKNAYLPPIAMAVGAGIGLLFSFTSGGDLMTGFYQGMMVGGFAVGLNQTAQIPNKLNGGE
ncbi:putative holin family protein [Carnobacterium phage cd3]|uniref:Holin family protein n=1 Tax=Carnobacterium phage cd2 TaxID=2849244 RepID=A0AAE7VH79_9CAUD|nr:putative holin family protein [Carnobacterium phage cd2]QXP45130.1 putative holin family protein [Carnobacterium phage cd2]QXP45314.1 putative holin family protein [Carnobacterium phage cd3]